MWEPSKLTVTDCSVKFTSTGGIVTTGYAGGLINSLPSARKSSEACDTVISRCYVYLAPGAVIQGGWSAGALIGNARGQYGSCTISDCYVVLSEGAEVKSHYQASGFIAQHETAKATIKDNWVYLAGTIYTDENVTAKSGSYQYSTPGSALFYAGMCDFGALSGAKTFSNNLVYTTSTDKKLINQGSGSNVVSDDTIENWEQGITVLTADQLVHTNDVWSGFWPDNNSAWLNSGEAGCENYTPVRGVDTKLDLPFLTHEVNANVLPRTYDVVEGQPDTATFTYDAHELTSITYKGSDGKPVDLGNWSQNNRTVTITGLNSLNIYGKELQFGFDIGDSSTVVVNLVPVSQYPNRVNVAEEHANINAVYARPTNAVSGTAVTVTADSDPWYSAEWTVTSGGEAVPFEVSGNSITFTMPGADVNVSAVGVFGATSGASLELQLLDDEEMDGASAYASRIGLKQSGSNYYLVIPAGIALDSDVLFLAPIGTAVDADGTDLDFAATTHISTTLGELLGIQSMTPGTEYSMTLTDSSGATKSVKVIWSANVNSLMLYSDKTTTELNSAKTVKGQGTAAFVEAGGTIVDGLTLKQIKGRGNTSWDQGGGGANGKRPYNVTIYRKVKNGDVVEKQPVELVSGATETTKWSLLHAWSDRETTSLSDGVFYDLYRNVNGSMALKTDYIDLYINGDYRGSYLISQKVEVAPGVVNVGETVYADDFKFDGSVTRVVDPNGGLATLPGHSAYNRIHDVPTTNYTSTDWTEVNIVDSAEAIAADEAIQSGVKAYQYATNAKTDGEDATITDLGGVLIELDRKMVMDDVSRETCFFISGKYTVVGIKEPEYADKATVQRIATLFEEFEQAIYSPSGYNSKGKHYTDYVDTDSLVKHILVSGFSAHGDTFYTSTYLSMAADGTKFSFGPLWDIDRPFCADDQIIVERNVSGDPSGQMIQWIMQKGDFSSALFAANEEYFNSAVSSISADTTALVNRVKTSKQIEYKFSTKFGWTTDTYKTFTDKLESRLETWKNTTFDTNTKLLGLSVGVENGALTADITGTGTVATWYKLSEADYTTVTEVSSDETYTPTESGLYYVGVTGTVNGKADRTMYSKPVKVSVVTLNANEGTIAEGKNVTFYVEGVGATLPTSADMTKPGYVFDCWYDANNVKTTEITADDTGDKTFTANWTPGDANYKVNHNWQNTELNGYDLHEYEDKTGTTGTQTAAEAKPYDGFTPEAVTQQTIAADGSTVVNINYNRNTYNVTFDAAGGEMTGAFDSYTYGIAKTLPTVTRIGYAFDGWYDANGAKATEISATDIGDKAFTAKWVEGEVNYTVQYYLQNIDDNEYTADNSELKTGITNATTDVTAETREGFTAKAIEQQKIAADGSTVVNVYYDRNSYDVTFKPANGGDATTASYRFGKEITIAEAPTYAGHEFNGWSDGTTTYQAGAAYTVPAQDVEFTAQWNASTFEATLYPAGGTLSKDVTKITFTFGEPYELPTATIDGRTFLGWQNEKGEIIPLSGTSKFTEAFTTLTAQYVSSAVPALKSFDVTNATADPETVTAGKYYYTLTLADGVDAATAKIILTFEPVNATSVKVDGVATETCSVEFDANASKTVEIVLEADGKVVNYTFSYTYTVPSESGSESGDPKITAYVNNVESNDTLQNILKNAPEGAVIKLPDVAEGATPVEIDAGGYLVNSNGKTIDLNGNILKAEGLFNVGGAKIVDSSEHNDGILRVEKGMIVLPDDNQGADKDGNVNFYLPVYDSTEGNSGYRFLKVEEGLAGGEQLKALKDHGTNDPSSSDLTTFGAADVNSVAFFFQPQFVYDKAGALLDDEKSGVEFKVNIHYQAKDKSEYSEKESPITSYVRGNLKDLDKDGRLFVEFTGVGNIDKLKVDFIYTYGNSRITFTADKAGNEVTGVAPKTADAGGDAGNS
jgi:uncharacterized repeat protein (TIGR02543 family)